MPLPTIPSGNVASQIPTGYDVTNSCLFEEAVMHKTPSSEGDTQKMTLSMWIKRQEIGVENQIWHTQNSSNQATSLVFASTDKLLFVADDSNKLVTTRVFRDRNAWYHICLAIDTTQGTAGNRAKLYINGVQETAFDTESQPSEDQNLQWNKTTSHRIGSQADTANNAFNGMIAEFVWIDGTQYAASDFGEFDEDSPTIWKPKDPSALTFGTNGFYLDFEASGNLGNDVNGGTDLTEVSIVAADQCRDTPTNNFSIMNRDMPLADGFAWENANTTFYNSSSAWESVFSNIGVTNGKWYFEMDIISVGNAGDGGGGCVVGIADLDERATVTSAEKFTESGRTAYGYSSNGSKQTNGGSTGSWGATWNTNDIIGCAFDLDNGKVYFSKNGTWQDSGDPTSGATGTGSAYNITTGVPYVAACAHHQDPQVAANFGGYDGGAFAVSSGNADDNGYGNFEYDVPAGYYAICTKNIAEFG